MLRSIDPQYRLTNHDQFAFLDARKLSLKERAVGELIEEGPSFLEDCATGELQAVSWIDPALKDLRVLGPDRSDVALPRGLKNARRDRDVLDRHPERIHDDDLVG